MTDAPPTLPDGCPPWCTAHDGTQCGRSWDGFEHFHQLNLLVRTHATDPGRQSWWAYVIAHEAAYADGLRWIGDVRIEAGVDDSRDDLLTSGLSAADARAFAARLLEAADEADSIERARRGA